MALPVPSFEAAGQAEGPVFSSLDSRHFANLDGWNRKPVKRILIVRDEREDRKPSLVYSSDEKSSAAGCGRAAVPARGGEALTCRIRLSLPFDPGSPAMAMPPSPASDPAITMRTTLRMRPPSSVTSDVEAH